MTKPKRILIALVFFGILTLISIATIITVHQAPTEETTSDVLGTYTSTATYDYTAQLNTSTIYTNKTTLKPGEGTLYTKITKQIDLTLTFTFNATIPTTPTISYNITRTLQTDAWQYQMASTAETTTNQNTVNITLAPFSETEIDPLIKTIDAETGTSSASEYSLDITPTFTVDATTPAGPIHQIFQPTLTISLNQTAQGNTITIDNLQQNEAGAITENVIVTHNEVTYERYASYIFLVASFAGLGFSIRLYSKAHVSIAGPDIDKLTAPYKDLVIEAKEIPKFSEDTPIISVKSLEELGKVAEILAQPMFHSHNAAEHTFFVFDSDMIYTYKISQEKS